MINDLREDSHKQIYKVGKSTQDLDNKLSIWLRNSLRQGIYEEEKNQEQR
jgi:hypothetical protein